MKIIGIGKNYADHVKEMSGSLEDGPVVFIKPDTALLRNNDPFFFPDFTKEIHHEIELVVKICKEGKRINKSNCSNPPMIKIYSNSIFKYI